MKIAFLLLISAFSLLSQTDLQRWGKADILYSKGSEERERDYSLSSENPIAMLAKTAAIIYWVTFSDVDGDNCPFHPTCSNFLLESVKETNVFQGTLMFFDRFTRDMNIAERRKHYPVFKKGHFYDPTTLYTLNRGNTHEGLRLMFESE